MIIYEYTIDGEYGGRNERKMLILRLDDHKDREEFASFCEEHLGNMHARMWGGPNGTKKIIEEEDSGKIYVYTMEADRFKPKNPEKYIENINYVETPSQIVRPTVDKYRYVGGKGNYGVGKVCLGKDKKLEFKR